MKASTILPAFLTLPFFVFAQKADDSFGLRIKANPTTLLTPETPTLTFGVELLPPKFQKHGLSLEFDHGFKCPLIKNFYPETLDYMPFDPREYYNKHYSKNHLELRKRFRPERHQIGFYVAAEVFFIPYTYDVANSYYHSQSDNTTYLFDAAHVSKNIKGADLKFGLIIEAASPLIFEVFAGWGVRHVNLLYSDVTNERRGGPNSREDYIPKEGEWNDLHLSLGLNIGYRFQW